VARFACIAATLVALLVGMAAEADADELRAAAAGSSVPAGSFESAGIAVFVRAHEARRSPVPPPLSSHAYVPVVTAVTIEGAQASGPAELAVPSTTGGTVRSTWVAPGEQPARPGALASRDPAEVASPFGRSGLLDMHRTPDLELPVSKRATLGVFGEANRIEPTDIRNSTVRTTRDLGAGVTLQYRFGE
jgi:hypothetical protein